MESRPRLGGRAYSFVDKVSGIEIDNCLHVILGCCRESIAFLKTIGSIDLIDFRRDIEIAKRNGSVATVKITPRLAYNLAKCALRKPGKSENADHWLKRLGCSDRLIDELIEPLLISALNEDIDNASAHYARKVIVSTMMCGASGREMGIPKAPMSKIIDEPAKRYLESGGCDVRLSSRVVGVSSIGRAAKYAVLESGEKIKADLFVLAVPPWSLQNISGFEWTEPLLDWKPIIAVNLFLPDYQPGYSARCVIGEPFQWVFDKSRDFGSGLSLVQTVASAAGSINGFNESQLVELALRSVRKAEPANPPPEAARAVVYKAAKATFATGGLCDLCRPGPQTRLENVYLAGDWTATSWPATLEGAVKSGRIAAEKALEI